MARIVGVVHRIVADRGFAFLRGEEDKRQRFFNVRNVEPISDFDTLKVGQKVTFEPVGDPATDIRARNNGLKAGKVRCLT